MRKQQRGLSEYLRFASVRYCPGCQATLFQERALAVHLSTWCRCPRCGTGRVHTRGGRDPIEDLYRKPLSRLQQFIGAKLRYCGLCRLQFYDRRPVEDGRAR